MQIGFIFSLIFAIIIAVFALQNGEIVTIDFIFTNVKISQAIVIFVSAALGAIIVAILGAIRYIKLGIRIKEQNKKIKTLENANKELKDRILELTNTTNTTIEKPIDEVRDNDDNEIKEEIFDNDTIDEEKENTKEIQ